MSGAHGNGESDRIVVGVAQIAPVWLDRGATLEKVAARVHEAAGLGADLVVDRTRQSTVSFEGS